MVKRESFSLLFEFLCIVYVLRDRRRQDGDGRTDEEKNVHVWRVVLSYDSYLLTTEKTFLLFRRVSLVLSCLLVCLCMCVRVLFYFLLRERERERERARAREQVSKQAMLALARARLLLLSPCVSLLHPLLDYYYYTSRRLLTIIHAFFCFGVGFFAYNTFTHNDEHR
jgi:Ca2+/Na+ antiporter